MIAALSLGLIILVAGLTTLAALRLFWHFRQRVVWAAGLIVLAMVGIIFCSGSAVTALGLVDYVPLGPEHSAAAEIVMLQNGQNRFRINLLRSGKTDWHHDFSGPRLCLMVHEIEWETPARWLDFQPMYRFASLSGHGDTEVHIPSRERLPLWRLSRQHSWLFWIKANPPLKLCLPMVTGARYRLIIGYGHITTRPLNAEASNALKQPRTHPTRNRTYHDI